MYTPKATGQFKKDLKQQIGDLEVLLKATGIMKRIVAGERLPPELRPHKLAGEYKDCWECHILPDLLLIWIPDTRKKSVTFVRLGTHSDLFG